MTRSTHPVSVLGAGLDALNRVLPRDRRPVDLARSHALVTGASSGIGEHIARQLAAHGTDLVLVARRRDALERLAQELRAAHPGRSVTVLPADLTEPDAVDGLVEQLRAAGVSIDVLINNAGVGSTGPFAETAPDVLARQLQLNCLALVALTRALLPGMLARGRGAVLDVASSAAFQPLPRMAVYAATKAFVLSFTEALWVELRGTGVQVVALCPGVTSTDFFVTAGEVPLRVSGTAQHVAAVAVRALASGRGPTVLTSLADRLGATGYRILPRGVMARVAGARMARAATSEPS